MAGNFSECFHSPVCTQDKEAQRTVFTDPVPLQLTATIYIGRPSSHLLLSHQEVLPGGGITENSTASQRGEP